MFTTNANVTKIQRNDYLIMTKINKKNIQMYNDVRLTHTKPDGIYQLKAQ